jgi:hypothetical protein
MIPNDIRSLNEAYLSVYNQEDAEDNLLEETTLLETIGDLYDDELEEIVEETIYDMLDEGYDFDEIEEIFEDLFSEARVDMAARAAEREKQRRESEASAKAARRRGASVVRKEKRAETISKVKGAVGSALQKVKGAVKSGIESAKEAGKEAKSRVTNVVDEPARSYAAKNKLISSKSGKTKLTSPAIQGKQRTSAGRREVRGAVVKHLASKALGKVKKGIESAKSSVKQKAASAAVSGYVAAKTAKGAASSAAQRAKGAASSAKASVKKGIRGAALNVARSMKEEQDLYDIVIGHLLDEGYAETVEAAEAIMVSMSEEWRTEIIEG